MPFCTLVCEFTRLLGLGGPQFQCAGHQSINILLTKTSSPSAGIIPQALVQSSALHCASDLCTSDIWQCLQGKWRALQSLSRRCTAFTEPSKRQIPNLKMRLRIGKPEVRRVYKCGAPKPECLIQIGGCWNIKSNYASPLRTYCC